MLYSDGTIILLCSPQNFMIASSTSLEHALLTGRIVTPDTAGLVVKLWLEAEAAAEKKTIFKNLIVRYETFADGTKATFLSALWIEIEIPRLSCHHFRGRRSYLFVCCSQEIEFLFSRSRVWNRYDSVGDEY